ncbi:MAG: hypothetical protein ACYCR3_08120 [Acidithiobacillus sp.]
MVNEWGKGSAQEALLARLRSFMPVPPKDESLTKYLGAGYPLFGNAGQRWQGIREMGFPFLVTENRILTECYARAVCPEGRETVALEALASGAWKIPDDLHIRVWTPQPKKKGELPGHVLPETERAFRDAGVRALEFMNTVKTAENSVRVPDMKMDVSQPFFDEWTSVARSGKPYICFLPEKKPASIFEGLRWFQSVFGMSFNGDNRTMTEDDLQVRLRSGGDADSSEAVWLWKVREWALADVAARRQGLVEADGWLDLTSTLEFRLNDVVKQARKTEKGRADLLMEVGSGLLSMVHDGKSSDVLETIDEMREDADCSEWWSQTQNLDRRIRGNGLNVTF